MSTVGELNVKIGADNSDLKKGIQESKGLLSGFGSMVKNSLSFAGGLAIFDTIKSGFKASIGLGMEFNSTMEQNKIAFDSMLGSASKADDILGKLSKMAATTPFEFPELATTAKKMLAFGFQADKIPDMLKKIGDAAAGLGMGADGVSRITIALGQMRAKNKVTAGEMMQLTEAGIPAWDILAKAMGKSTAEVMALSEKGLIPADKAINQLVDGMEERFPNMMAKQSKSFQGLMSTLKDSVQMTFGKILEPAFNSLTSNILPSVIDKIGSFADAIQSGKSPVLALEDAIVENFGKNAGLTFENFISTINNLKDGLLSLTPVLTEVFKYFVETAIPKLAEFGANVGPTIKGIFQDISDILYKLEPILETITSTLTDITLGNFTTMISLVKDLTGALKDLLNFDWSGLGEHLKNALPSLDKLFTTANAINNPSGYIAGKVMKKISSMMPDRDYEPRKEGYATGTTNATPGTHLVGENGPELINFKGGEEVLNTTQTQRALNGSKQPAIINLYAGTRKIAEAIIDDLNSLQGQQNQLAFRGGGLR